MIHLLKTVMMPQKWAYNCSKMSICLLEMNIWCLKNKYIMLHFWACSVLNNEYMVFSNLSVFILELFWVYNILNIWHKLPQFWEAIFFSALTQSEVYFYLHWFSISAYRAYHFYQTKDSVTFFRFETIVASFLHLVAVICRVHQLL